MNLSVAIVDDLQADRDRLSADLHALFHSMPEHSLSTLCFESAEAFLSRQPEVQLVFLDILMDGITGIDLARRLRGLDEKLLIVFVSSSPEFAFDAFPVHPFDYLIKPYQADRLMHVVQEAMRVLHRSDPKVAIRVSRAVHNVPIGKIISAVSRGHNVDITLHGADPLQALMTFADVERLLLPHARFLTMNRGVLVNMDYALSLSGDTVLLQDGRSFALNSRRRAEIVASFNQYQFSRLKGVFDG